MFFHVEKICFAWDTSKGFQLNVISLGRIVVD